MVKKLDDNLEPLLDHVGARLWHAYRAWHAEFADAMRSAGHGWFTESRATLLGYIAPSGTRQAALIEKMGVTKQAVQQLLDGLEAERVIERVPDPKDSRGKIVRYTPKGLAALADGDDIKLALHQRMLEKVGKQKFAAMMDALGTIGGPT